MDLSYWLKQTPDKPLFPGIEWSRPEQKTRAGKLAIIGGNKLGFVAVGESYNTAIQLGAGQVRAILPDALKKSIPAAITGTIFVSGNQSGGFSREALPELNAACAWANVCLLIGDSGRNSETAIAFESMLGSYGGHMVITRDAVDLLRPAAQKMIERPQTTLVLSFAQLQKLFQSVYYPKILSFSMQLMQLVESLHKFTTTYPVTIVTFHQSHIIVAHDGNASTTPFDEPMMIWRGTTATRAACYLLWTPEKAFETITTSIISA
jgi:NAD(P)H-hydrate repair Nnr-like enzyme with NAD(P)H-hydrate dehydratase domain